mmetsp:Transcript_28106/g.56317  ORF Transcript_28106/g.56317 Transcript_28106/m.56317 type:complete len:242 (-) Transcript_28106:214-939(-)
MSGGAVVPPGEARARILVRGRQRGRGGPARARLHRERGRRAERAARNHVDGRGMYRAPAGGPRFFQHGGGPGVLHGGNPSGGAPRRLLPPRRPHPGVRRGRHALLRRHRPHRPSPWRGHGPGLRRETRGVQPAAPPCGDPGGRTGVYREVRRAQAGAAHLRDGRGRRAHVRSAGGYPQQGAAGDQPVDAGHGAGRGRGRRRGGGEAERRPQGDRDRGRRGAGAGGAAGERPDYRRRVRRDR